MGGMTSCCQDLGKQLSMCESIHDRYCICLKIPTSMRLTSRIQIVSGNDTYRLEDMMSDQILRCQHDVFAASLQVRMETVLTV